MYRASITNELNRRQYQADFPTKAERTAWINEQVLKNSWGKPQRWVHENFMTDELDTRVLDTRTITLEGSGIDETEPKSYKEYEVKADYVITLTDLTKNAEWSRKQRLASLPNEVKKHEAAVLMGQRIIALMGKKNDEKALTHEQKDSLMADASLQTIISMLTVGRLGRSKQLVDAYTPDGTLVTEEDKAEISQLLGDWLAENY